MKRVEAYEKAVKAVQAMEHRREERRKTPFRFSDEDLPCSMGDWAQPSLWNVLEALEALGVLKFEEEKQPDSGFIRARSVPVVDPSDQPDGGVWVTTGSVIDALHKCGYRVTPAGKSGGTTTVHRTSIEAAVVGVPSYHIAGFSNEERAHTRKDIVDHICKYLGI